MTRNYDAIVVGARCAGSPTAMLLAQKGYRVLLVDRATFPSDTVSTHVVHAPGVAALGRWGLRDQLAATGCPPITNYRFDFGFFVLEGSPRPIDGEAEAFCPRRTIIDKLLVDAAGAAGVDVREGFTVDEIVIEDGTVVGITGRDSGGTSVTERAQVVIGADGRNSFVAKAVEPEQYNERPAVGPAAYSYFSGVTSSGFEAYIRDECGFAAFPTHDDLTLVIAGTTVERWKDFHADLETNFLNTLDGAPALAEQVRAGKREERFHAATDLAAYFRKPFGPGWALVGDAGYHKHPITAQGITDAFLDAERLVGALDSALGGGESYDDALSRYQKERDEHVMPMYDLTFGFATMEPPPPDMQQLLGALVGNQDATNDFMSVQAGTMPLPEFFAPDNVGRIMAAAAS
jgi:2-polyprenyl-6-methoxyphenol hydroxylase-like FAD-dependent oxidoreductase